MMKLTDWMDEKGLCVGVTLKDKEGVIDILAALQQKCGNTDRGRELRRDIYYREEQAPFAIGAGVAVCSLRSEAVKRPMLTAITVPDGVDLGAPDGEKSRLVFLAALPPEKGQDPLSRLTVLLMNENLREQLVDAADEKTFLALLRLAEEGAYSSTQAEASILLLAVVDEALESATEAASSLQLAAGRAGILLKMEKQGSTVFSEQDLREADGILLIGKDLISDRFDGKPVLEIDTSDGIYRPEHLLKAVRQAPVYHKKIFFRRKKSLADFYYRSNVPLLPLILLVGGVFLMIGELFCSIPAVASLCSAVQWIGERSLMLLLPRVSAMLGFRYARWPGLAVGLIGGAILEAVCGGVWAALLGGIMTALLMRYAEKKIGMLPKRFRWLEWFAPVGGVAAIGGMAYLLGWGVGYLQNAYFWLSSVSNIHFKGLLYGVGVGLDPGGPIYRAALGSADSPEILAAMTAGGLALTFGVTLFCLLGRKKMDEIHYANGWTALPAGLGGYAKSYLVFFAGDPFRIAPCAAIGTGAAGLLAVSMKCRTEALGLSGLLSCNRPGGLVFAVLCGTALMVALFFLSKKEFRGEMEE